MASPIFNTTIQVNIEAINYGGHLSHDRLVTMMHEARLRFFDYLGQSEVDFYGNGLILQKLTVNYKKEAFRGEKLLFNLSVTQIRGAGFTLAYNIVNSEGECVATAESALVAFDYSARKVTRLSPQFTQQVNALPV